VSRRHALDESEQLLASIALLTRDPNKLLGLCEHDALLARPTSDGGPASTTELQVALTPFSGHGLSGFLKSRAVG
jgi:hypothetical protein